MLFWVVLNNNLLITNTSTKHSWTQTRQIVKSVTNASAFILVYFLTEGLRIDNSNYFISINCRLSMSCWKSKELSSKNTLRQHLVYLQTREIKTLKIKNFPFALSWRNTVTVLINHCLTEHTLTANFMMLCAQYKLAVMWCTFRSIGTFLVWVSVSFRTHRGNFLLSDTKSVPPWWKRRMCVMFWLSWGHLSLFKAVP